MLHEVTGDELALAAARALVDVGLPARWDEAAEREHETATTAMAAVDVLARAAEHIPGVMQTCAEGQAVLRASEFCERFPELPEQLLVELAEAFKGVLDHGAKQARMLLLGAQLAAAQDARDALTTRDELRRRAAAARAGAVEPQRGPAEGP